MPIIDRKSDPNEYAATSFLGFFLAALEPLMQRNISINAIINAPKPTVRTLKSEAMALKGNDEEKMKSANRL